MKSLALKAGDVVVINDEPYIVARVSYIKWQIISLRNGNRWTVPFEKKSETITLDEIINDTWEQIETYSVILNPLIEVKEVNHE